MCQISRLPGRVSCLRKGTRPVNLLPLVAKTGSIKLWFATGLHAVVMSILLIKRLHLDEAMCHLQNPPEPKAVYLLPADGHFRDHQSRSSKQHIVVGSELI